MGKHFFQALLRKNGNSSLRWTPLFSFSSPIRGFWKNYGGCWPATQNDKFDFWWWKMVKIGCDFPNLPKSSKNGPFSAFFLKKTIFGPPDGWRPFSIKGGRFIIFFPSHFLNWGGGVNTPNFARRIFFAIYVFSTHRFSIKWLPIVVCPQFENVDLEAQLCKSTGGILCSGNTTCICQCPIPTATRPGPEGHSLSGILQLQVLSNSSKLLV